MANTLQKKPFLGYPAQIKNLKQKQLVINDEASATTTLVCNDLHHIGRNELGKMLEFATVISLKYLLDATDFRLFYYESKYIRFKIGQDAVNVDALPDSRVTLETKALSG